MLHDSSGGVQRWRQLKRQGSRQDGCQWVLPTLAAMDTNFRLDDLFDHLLARCSGPPGRAAAKRWRAAEPALAGVGHPLDALALCRTRCEVRRANEALGALVRLGANDDLAALTALVALVPGLGSVARRLGRCGGIDQSTLEADLASAAWEVIRALPAERLEWPASLILSRTRDRLRSAALSNARRRAARVGAGALEGLAAGPARSALERLALALGEAHRADPGSREALRVVFATRVWGTPTAKAAAECGLEVGTLRTRRARAERCVIRLAERGAITAAAVDEAGSQGGGR